MTVCDVRSSVPYTIFCSDVSTCSKPACIHVPLCRSYWARMTCSEAIDGWCMPCRQPTQRTMSYDTPSSLHLRTRTTVRSPPGIVHCFHLSCLPSSRLVEEAAQHAAPGPSIVSWKTSQCRSSSVSMLCSVFHGSTWLARSRQRRLTPWVRWQRRAAADARPITMASAPSLNVRAPSSRPPGTFSVHARCVSACSSSSSGSSSNASEGSAAEDSSDRAGRRASERVHGDLTLRAARTAFLSNEARADIRPVSGRSLRILVGGRWVGSWRQVPADRVPVLTLKRVLQHFL